uniref:Proteasome subunit alpha type n=1 Tax=Oryza punctata TaxID=4537 RepID=A0A0E0L451_ORYPU
MSSIGTGYDLSVTTFSPDGRVFQVEYAGKAVDNSGTVVGIKCKDGIVLGVEKLVTSKMILKGIYGVHDEAKDKDFELELSWVCDESKRQHEKVPDDLVEQAKAAAQAALEEMDAD